MLLSEDETPIVDKLAKKRPAAEFEEEGVTCAVGFALFYSFTRKYHNYMFHFFKKLYLSKTIKLLCKITVGNQS